MKIILPIIIAYALTITSLANADIDHHAKSPSFKSTPLTDNIFMLQGNGGNLGLITGKDGLLLIDADYKVMSDALKTELAKHGGVEKLNYLINTHWHGDHTQGNHALGHHAQIVAHDNVRKRLATTQEIKLFKAVSKPYPKHALPSITYETRMSLHVNDEELKIVHFPGGHTDGDSVIFFEKSNIVHMGDLFFMGFFPFVDVENGGNVLTLAKNVKTILGMIDDKTNIIPGHGPLSNKADLQAFHDMLIDTSAEVKAMMDKGLSLEKIQAQGLSAKWKSWAAKSFLPAKVWIGIVYNSLSQ
ncbi:MAG: MBL fold metallo-hydrolase [Pseudomonadales bacterium]|nr:MBL fold metallo-hydrolase [Pseudomonadales bacterium]